jgi:hypothetical protein
MFIGKEPQQAVISENFQEKIRDYTQHDVTAITSNVSVTPRSSGIWEGYFFMINCFWQKTETEIL